MNRSYLKNKNKGFSLMEVLIVISVTSIMGVVISSMFKMSTKAYLETRSTNLLAQTADEILQEIEEGGVSGDGIKDAVQLINISSSTQFTFVPLWIDETHDNDPGALPYTMNAAVKAWNLPVVEYINRITGDVSTNHPYLFADGDDTVLNDDSNFYFDTSGEPMRFVFIPESSTNTNAQMIITYDAANGYITKTYRGETKTLPSSPADRIIVSDLSFTYYDYNNNALTDNAYINNVASVGISMTLKLGSAGESVANLVASSTAPSYQVTDRVNLRNSSSGGGKAISLNNMTLTIPSSADIRKMELAEYTSGTSIELLATGNNANTWKLILTLNAASVLSWDIQTPTGSSQCSGGAKQFPLDLLNIDAGGCAYDYNEAGLTSPVTLQVTSDANNVALFVRP